jgi:type II secretory pathway component PulC
MKFFLLIIGLIVSTFTIKSLNAQTVLQTGDIAIVMMNADGTDPWAFVTFVDLAV